MRRYPVRVLVPVLVGVVFTALPIAQAGADTPAGDDGSGPGVPESTVVPPTTDPEDTETPPTDDEPVGRDDGQSALALALGVAGLALLVVLAGRWMIHRSDLDDLPPAPGPPGWPRGDVP